LLPIGIASVFLPLKEAARYKGAHGGRGSGKSHFFAEQLIIHCLEHPGLRAVCLREVQQSLKQSSKLLLEDKIVLFRVGNQFRVLEDRIETPGDGIIIFQGMQNHTAESIKSLEGYDIAWFDEAHRASKFSLGLLRPTLRKQHSQLWFSWNPNSDSDPVEELLRGPERPKDSIVVEANYSDNPLFPDVLREEMEYDKRRDPDRYAHVWMGKYQVASEARVFRNWRIEEFETPRDARFYMGADWGFAVDPTVLVRCFISGRTLFVDFEAWKVGCDIDHTPALFAGGSSEWQNPYGWQGIPGAHDWPIIADSSNPQAISYLKRFGFNIEPAIKGVGSIEEGITFLKSYDIVVHPRCKHVADELATYSYETDKKTEEVLPKLADKKNHCVAEGTLVTCERGDVPIEQVTTKDSVLTRGGYRRVLFVGQTDVQRETLLVRTTAGSVRCTPDHKIYTSRGFTRADALSGELRRLMMSSESALSVINISGGTSTHRHKLVHGRVLTVTDGGIAERVYDLTVEGDHEFFAGGVLVHNCIDSLRYAVENERRATYDSSLSWVGYPTIEERKKTGELEDPTVPPHFVPGRLARIDWNARGR
jgi:phage terminase large subunit